MVVHGGGTSRQCSADLGSSLVSRSLRLRGGATPQMTPEYAEFLKKENDPAVSKWEADKQASASARWEFGADQWREMGYYELLCTRCRTHLAVIDCRAQGRQRSRELDNAHSFVVSTHHRASVLQVDISQPRVVRRFLHIKDGDNS